MNRHTIVNKEDLPPKQEFAGKAKVIYCGYCGIDQEKTSEHRSGCNMIVPCEHCGERLTPFDRHPPKCALVKSCHECGLALDKSYPKGERAHAENCSVSNRQCPDCRRELENLGYSHHTSMCSYANLFVIYAPEGERPKGDEYALINGKFIHAPGVEDNPKYCPYDGNLLDTCSESKKNCVRYKEVVAVYDAPWGGDETIAHREYKAIPEAPKEHCEGCGMKGTHAGFCLAVRCFKCGVFPNSMEGHHSGCSKILRRCPNCKCRLDGRQHLPHSLDCPGAVKCSDCGEHEVHSSECPRLHRCDLCGCPNDCKKKSQCEPEKCRSCCKNICSHADDRQCGKCGWMYLPNGN